MNTIGFLSINGQKVTLVKSHIILKANEKITYIYFLNKVMVDYYNCLDHPREEVFIYRNKGSSELHISMGLGCNDWRLKQEIKS
jgi:hypothetical protein